MPAHGGSVQFTPAPEPNPEWGNFAARVTAAWNAFVDSGYSPALRGANNTREYRPPQSVLGRRQGAQGALVIGGATYTIANSLSASVSLHRPIPAAHQVGNIRSFIFHL